MGNILNLATTGLLTFQQSITNTGQNIANVNTEGYSRQTVEFMSRTSTRFGTNMIGNGVQIANISRHSNQLINMQLRDSFSVSSELSTFYTHATFIDGILSDPSTSVASSMTDFFASMHAAIESPDFAPARQSLLSQSELLINRFHTIDQNLDAAVGTINTELIRMVDEINSIATNIAKINTQLVSTVQAPELLDQRDVLLNDLAKLVSVSVIEQDNGSLNVNIGNGQSLVVEGISASLTSFRNPKDPALMDVAFNTNSGPVIITSQLTGGALGGLLGYYDELIAPATRQLDKIALGLVVSINDQHQLGMDANDNLGGFYFKDVNDLNLQQGRAIANNNNTGNGVFNVRIDDVSLIKPDEYQLAAAAGPSYSLIRLSDNTTTTFASFPQTVDGFTISLASGSFAVGDSFLISPTRNMASSMELNVTDGSQIALAAPIRTSLSTANTGTGLITAGTVVDATNTSFTTTAGQLSPPLRVEFLSSTSYQVVNATTSAVIEGPLVYNPAISNNVFPTAGSYDPGYRVEISGAPAIGDNFTIDYNSGGIGDSRNGALMTDIQSKKLLNNGNSTLSDTYGTLISNVGSKTHAADINREASEVLLQNAQARRESFSGVNLDEEAANLLRFEQAYQATAQLINVASQLFDIILQTVGR